ncbi:hypothetical protein ACFE04_020801 [Oxalis oulophora]
MTTQKIETGHQDTVHDVFKDYYGNASCSANSYMHANSEKVTSTIHCSASHIFSALLDSHIILPVSGCDNRVSVYSISFTKHLKRNLPTEKPILILVKQEREFHLLFSDCCFISRFLNVKNSIAILFSPMYVSMSSTMNITHCQQLQNIVESKEKLLSCKSELPRLDIFIVSQLNFS